MADRRTLRYGPYATPRVRIGQIVECAARGRLRVHSLELRGHIVWPMGILQGQSPGRASHIIMGDLVRALRREAAGAVAAHWGVSGQAVRRWRRAIGVERVTEGTRAVLQTLGRPEIAQHAAEGAAASLEPEIRRRRDQAHAESMRRRPRIREEMTRLARTHWDRRSTDG